jgi:hypothetical protein
VYVKVPCVNEKKTEFRVVGNVSSCSGQSLHVAVPGGSSYYELVVYSVHAGIEKGTLTFVMDNGESIWYNVCFCCFAV